MRTSSTGASTQYRRASSALPRELNRVNGLILGVKQTTEVGLILVEVETVDGNLASTRGVH
jgi:hypothetical protein